jgi:uncharacterized protein YidB (DUF937 family)
MGLLDSVFSEVMGSGMGAQDQQSATNPLGSILESLAGGNQQQTGSLLAAAMSMLQQNGGLGGVLEMLRSRGLGAQADSWVGTGANMAVSGDQLHQVFGESAFGNVASQLGMPQGQASSAIAQILPELINQLTPNGQMPDNDGDLISRGLSMLRAGSA